MQHYDEEKKEASKSTSQPAAPTQKAASSVASPSQQPAWTQSMGNHPPANLQAKLTVNQPGDPHEQEADRVADQVVTRKHKATPAILGEEEEEQKLMRKHTGTPAVLGEEEEEQRLMRKQRSSSAQGESAPPIVSQALSSGGQPLDAGTQASMESHFGQDFSDVRIHTDGQAANSAQAINARAYTVGKDVVSGEGQYAPGTSEGERLLAHELTHVVQQAGQIATGITRRKPTDEMVAKQKEKERIAKLERDYKNAVETGDWDNAALLLNTYDDEDILAKLNKLSAQELASLKAGAERSMPGWSDRVTKPIDQMWMFATQTILGTTRGGRPVTAYYFPGTSNERALIIGGVHGSEQAGIQVATMLADSLRTGPKPYYSVIIVPVLFPDNYAAAQAAHKEPSDDNTGRYTASNPVDPNRNFPAPGESLASAQKRGGGVAKDAEGRLIQPENVMLLELINHFRPSRIASVHSFRPEGLVRGKAAAGIFADPHTVSSQFFGVGQRGEV